VTLSVTVREKIMLSFVQNWFAPRVNPIGVDFGSDCLRLAQVQFSGRELRLVAAASADVPSHVRHNPAARVSFFIDTVRELLTQGNFRSRQTVLGLPAASMYIQHLRMPRLDEEETRKALPWETRGKLPIDPSQALMRHLIAGEVYQDQEPRNEVIVMAAQRELVNQLLAGAAKAKLDVVGMNVEPKAIVDCFGHMYRRKADADAITCFLDIGCCGSRAFIARGADIFFARCIPIGGDHFHQAVAQALKISFDEAKLLRMKLCPAHPVAEEQQETPPVAAEAVRAPEPSIENSFPVLGAALQAKGAIPPGGAGGSFEGAVPGTAASPQGLDLEPPPHPQRSRVDVPMPIPAALLDQAQQVEQACREPLRRLIQELDLCRRYYEATFPRQPVDRLVFIGGESRHRALCQTIARELGLAAQLGDPLARMSRESEGAIESGIDRRQPQPAWSVAIGLSLGPVNVPATAGAASDASRGGE
jgi:type IV pilus assembly protein PilM